MRGHPGRIYETKDGSFVTAMNADQLPEYTKEGKVMVIEAVPGNTLFPEMNDEFSTVQKVLKDRDQLRLVGFID